MNFLIHLVISAILLWAPQGLLDPVIFSCLAALFVFFLGGGVKDSLGFFLSSGFRWMSKYSVCSWHFFL